MTCWLKRVAFLLGLLSTISPLMAYQSNQLSPKQQALIDKILVEKQKHLMTVFHHDRSVKTYRIALGFSPTGHKTHAGDGKTPEGTYFIVSKNSNSKFHLSLKLSYPSANDQQSAKSRGENPGGNIMIHGLAPHLSDKGKWHAMKDWTLGCIAITNDEIEELFKLASIGTQVVITP